MESIYQNLQQAHVRIARYVELDEHMEQRKFRIQLYSRRRMFVWWGVAAGWIIYLLWYRIGDLQGQGVVVPGLLSFGGSIAAMQYVIGPILDRRKKTAMERQATTEFTPMIAEMNLLADELEKDSVLPPKYRTLHACTKLLEYVENGRIATLREGINLYEEEASRDLQHQQLRQLAQQNQQLIRQQQTLIKNTRDMVRAQRVTNDLLRFR
ncbi:hypothetical protein [Parapedobacter lycopersici]|uniref:hypothetical protein n=1 Tax=Parapedobacter lycopersici TaxID=1864939 RepID=UPI00214D882C|nr:hypothetical protein [Parapedobacter lycopersici]